MPQDNDAGRNENESKKGPDVGEFCSRSNINDERGNTDKNTRPDGRDVRGPKTRVNS